MRLIYAGVGALSAKDPLDQAAQDYAQRLTHYTRFELRTVEAVARKGGASDEKIESEEAARLRKLMPARAWQVALDERGKLHTTDALSKRLSTWLNSGRDVILYQGGPTGLSDELKASCDETWSLSPLTLPHRLARVVALEALYRAFTVLRGEPYHRA
ncbi:MAG: 23S rRNA (pseudouridine(1915)-N(3))-methyltransferase RlmH [Myxococcota bacterium]